MNNFAGGDSESPLSFCLVAAAESVHVGRVRKKCICEALSSSSCPVASGSLQGLGERLGPCKYNVILYGFFSWW
jgi:hypothetical protein